VFVFFILFSVSFELSFLITVPVLAQISSYEFVHNCASSSNGDSLSVLSYPFEYNSDASVCIKTG